MKVIANKEDIKVEEIHDNFINIDGVNKNYTIHSQKNEDDFIIQIENQYYNATVVNSNFNAKLVTVRVNGNNYEINIQNKLDELLKSMGMEAGNDIAIKELKAPMPGLVIDVNVEPSQKVEKGDKLLILEAMKMENVIKSPVDGVIKSIEIKKQETVEKNKVMITFE